MSVKKVYPAEKKPDSISFVDFAQKKAGYLPKKHLMGVGLLQVFFLTSAMVFISMLLSGRGSDNKTVFMISAMICFITSLFFAHVAKIHLAKNFPLVNFWTLDVIYRRLFARPAQEFGKLHLSEIKIFLSEITEEIKSYFVDTYVVIVSSIIILAVTTGLFYVDKYLAYLLVFLIIIIALFGFILSKNKDYHQGQAALKKTLLSEQLDGFYAAFDALIGLQAQTPAMEKIAQSNLAVKKHEERIFYIKFFLAIARFALPLIFVWFLVIGLIYLDRPDLEVWQIFFMFFIAIVFGQAVAFLLQNPGVFAPIEKNSAKKLDDLCAIKDSLRVKIINVKGGIELLNLSFHYDDDSSLILKNINLKINPGMFHVISGPSGIGKSTLLQILMAQLLPKSGQVIFDGQDVLSLDLPHLRRNFGVLRQESQIMAGSVLDNIIAGRDLPIKTIQDLMLRHEVFDLLIDLPMGLQTYVYWHAKNLSRLEQILVLLARAVVHKPKILFLDEALMGAAPYEQKLLGKFLHELPATKILVSHENKNTYNADEMFLLS